MASIACAIAGRSIEPSSIVRNLRPCTAITLKGFQPFIVAAAYCRLEKKGGVRLTSSGLPPSLRDVSQRYTKEQLARDQRTWLEWTSTKSPTMIERADARIPSFARNIQGTESLALDILRILMQDADITLPPKHNSDHSANQRVAFQCGISRLFNINKRFIRAGGGIDDTDWTEVKKRAKATDFQAAHRRFADDYKVKAPMNARQATDLWEAYAGKPLNFRTIRALDPNDLFPKGSTARHRALGWLAMLISGRREIYIHIQ